MFNKELLREQYKLKAMSIKPPAAHEKTIRMLYEADQKRRNSSARPLRPALLKMVAALVAVAVVSGFTGYVWYHYGDNRVSFQYAKPESSKYDEALTAQIRDGLTEVKAKLETGESAVVYTPELAKLFNKGDTLIEVSNPAVIAQLAEWKVMLDQNAIEYKLPSSASNGLEFVGGQGGPPFGGFVSLESLEFLPELKRESEAAAGKVVWKKQVGKKEEKVFTTIYRNERQDEIYVSMQFINQKTDFKTVPGSKEKETINVHGTDVHYFKTQPFFLSESNMVQDIQWLETYDNHTLVYSVGSSSPDISKAELLVIVNEMLGTSG